MVFNTHVLIIVIPGDCYRPSADYKLHCREHLGKKKFGILWSLPGPSRLIDLEEGH